MKIDLAYVCFSCREIQDCAPHGKCETCGSEDVHPLTQFVELAKRIKVVRMFNFVYRKAAAERI